ncbi:hypothetical protein EYF80_030497 [Liparis tanakae]|uniref:Uncharacterized protein n=1 Tax=Liparis tanakae TaxID=230148 RepID=A0A4Z2H1I9_9TELE|nr:hypothetical protein EYF80_030497 [Liparis tanakae]
MGRRGVEVRTAEQREVERAEAAAGRLTGQSTTPWHIMTSRVERRAAWSRINMMTIRQRKTEWNFNMAADVSEEAQGEEATPA